MKIERAGPDRFISRIQLRPDIIRPQSYCNFCLLSLTLFRVRGTLTEVYLTVAFLSKFNGTQWAARAQIMITMINLK